MPLIKSSIIIFSPGFSNFFIEFLATSIDSQISTPFPAAKPSYLIQLAFFYFLYNLKLVQFFQIPYIELFVSYSYS